MTGSRTTVLVVEDDEAMAVALRDGFQLEGYRVVSASDGVRALELVASEAPDIVLLDVMLPALSGLDVCRQLRGRENRIPIIMLTARGQEADKVLGLRLGADDYVTKPFSLLELLARVESVLRRSHRTSSENGVDHHYRFGEIQLDFEHHEARRDGKPLDLSPREFLLLDFFVRHRGRVVSRDELLDAVWGYDSIPFTRTVDTHIAKLRKKIEKDPARPRFLVTVHRLGYKFTG